MIQQNVHKNASHGKKSQSSPQRSGPLGKADSQWVQRCDMIPNSCLMLAVASHFIFFIEVSDSQCSSLKHQCHGLADVHGGEVPLHPNFLEVVKMDHHQYHQDVPQSSIQSNQDGEC